MSVWDTLSSNGAYMNFHTVYKIDIKLLKVIMLEFSDRMQGANFVKFQKDYKLPQRGR